MTATRATGLAVTPEIIPFRSQHEEGCLSDAAAVPPALIINPEANLESLLGAAISRVSHLDASLDAWSCAGDTSATVAEVVYPLRRIAEEASLLLDRARVLMLRAGRRS